MMVNCDLTLNEMIAKTDVRDQLPYVNRSIGFALMRDFIAARARSVKHKPQIVETGCVRAHEDWTAGYSTVIFDRIAQEFGAEVASIDINQDHVNFAAQRVSGSRTRVICADSVGWLGKFNGRIDLLYLDSYDIDHRDQHPSALHHLMELTAAIRLLNRPAMVAVDDNFSGMYRPLAHRYQSSKGAYIRRFFDHLGILPIHDEHQTIWVVNP